MKGGRKKGRKEGRNEGRKEGREEGRKEGRKDEQWGTWIDGWTMDSRTDRYRVGWMDGHWDGVSAGWTDVPTVGQTERDIAASSDSHCRSGIISTWIRADFESFTANAPKTLAWTGSRCASSARTVRP